MAAKGGGCPCVESATRDAGPEGRWGVVTRGLRLRAKPAPRVALLSQWSEFITVRHGNEIVNSVAENVGYTFCPLPRRDHYLHLDEIFVAFYGRFNPFDRVKTTRPIGPCLVNLRSPRSIALFCGRCFLLLLLFPVWLCTVLLG